MICTGIFLSMLKENYKVYFFLSKNDPIWKSCELVTFSRISIKHMRVYRAVKSFQLKWNEKKLYSHWTYKSV